MTFLFFKLMGILSSRRLGSMEHNTNSCCFFSRSSNFIMNNHSFGASSRTVMSIGSACVVSRSPGPHFYGTTCHAVHWFATSDLSPFPPLSCMLFSPEVPMRTCKTCISPRIAVDLTRFKKKSTITIEIFASWLSVAAVPQKSWLPPSLFISRQLTEEELSDRKF